MQAPVIDGKKTVFVVIMRAGDGFLDGMLEVVPGARVGHVGLYRDPKTLVAVEYYFKMPHDMHERDAIVLDPMLATGHSAAAALSRLKAAGASQIHLVSLLTAPETRHRASEQFGQILFPHAAAMDTHPVNPAAAMDLWIRLKIDRVVVNKFVIHLNFPAFRLLSPGNGLSRAPGEFPDPDLGVSREVAGIIK